VPRGINWVQYWKKKKSLRSQI